MSKLINANLKVDPDSGEAAFIIMGELAQREELLRQIKLLNYWEMCFEFPLIDILPTRGWMLKRRGDAPSWHRIIDDIARILSKHQESHCGDERFIFNYNLNETIEFHKHAPSTLANLN